MRCHQIRMRFPDAVVIACILTGESDLSNLRSRIPTEDAQHVVCSLQLMKAYVSSLLRPTALPVESSAQTQAEATVMRESSETAQELERPQPEHREIQCMD